jgi:HPt (histidine-containing phosphotransfer) domain-containing protein
MSHLIDESVIQQMRSDLGEATCHTLIGLFIDELTTSLDNLAKAFDMANLQRIEDITHILKNSAALYGAIAVATLATEINDRLCIANGNLIETDSTILALIRQTLELYNNKYGK